MSDTAHDAERIESLTVFGARNGRIWYAMLRLVGGHDPDVARELLRRMAPALKQGDWRARVQVDGRVDPAWVRQALGDASGVGDEQLNGCTSLPAVGALKFTLDAPTSSGPSVLSDLSIRDRLVAAPFVAVPSPEARDSDLSSGVGHSPLTMVGLASTEPTFRHLVHCGVPAAGGEGAVIAMIDSGLNAARDEFPEGSVIVGPRFGADGLEAGNADDHPHDHGTLMASAIMGRTQGVAPEGRLLAVAALEPDMSQNLTAEPAAIIAALEYVGAWRDDDDRPVDILNLSLQSYVEAPAFERAFGVALRNITDLGITSLIASGNQGPGAESASRLAHVGASIVVGATSDDDSPWPGTGWSGRHKIPHVYAPCDGVRLPNVLSTSAFARGSADKSTSLATAVASGVAACVLADLRSQQGATNASVVTPDRLRREVLRRCVSINSDDVRPDRGTGMVSVCSAPGQDPVDVMILSATQSGASPPAPARQHHARSEMSDEKTVISGAQGDVGTWIIHKVSDNGSGGYDIDAVVGYVWIVRDYLTHQRYEYYAFDGAAGISEIPIQGHHGMVKDPNNPTHNSVTGFKAYADNRLGNPQALKTHIMLSQIDPKGTGGNAF